MALSLDEVLDAAVPFALPLRQRFRGLELREGVLIEGPTGWGEFAPFDDYSDEAAGRWLSSALEASYGSWPTAVRAQIPVNAIVPALAPDDAAALTRAAVLDHGCRTIKVKVGSAALADDEARVASVRAVLDVLLGPGVGAIRIDANAAWDAAGAARALHALAAYGLEYVEQPCPDSEQLTDLRARTDVPIAIDETIRRAASPQTSVRSFADVAVLKPAPLGGVEATLRLAERLDVPVVISGSLDSSVGLAPALAAAAALPELPYACGLGTGALLAADLCAPLVPADGRLPVTRREPDPSALDTARDRISAAWSASWRDRLVRAWRAREHDHERLTP